MPARIYKLLGGSYHDDKGVVNRNELVISDSDLEKIHRGKFRPIVIEQLSKNEVENYKKAIERFCKVEVHEKNQRYNTVSTSGVYILREWGTKAKADAAAKKERAKADKRKSAFLKRLGEVIPIIERDIQYHELEADLDDDDEVSEVDLTGSGGTE